MRDATRLAADYIGLWNETNQARRQEMLATTWSADATYTDPLMHAAGRREVEGLIAAVQERFPSFRFALAGPVDGFGEHVRFSWTLGPPGGQAVIKGTDFVTRDGDHIRSVTGFLDQVPAA